MKISASIVSKSTHEWTRVTTSKAWVALGKFFEGFVYLAVEIYHRGTLPSATPSFQVGKNFENRKIHQRRRSAWVGQADFGKLELNNRNHSGNCQRLSGKRDQFEARSIWRSLKQSQKFSDLRAFVVNGRGCYYSLHFNVFTKTLFRRAIHKLLILRHFNVFTGTLYRGANYSLPRHLHKGGFDVRIQRVIRVILGFAVTVAIWPREVVSCRHFSLRATSYSVEVLSCVTLVK